MTSPLESAIKNLVTRLETVTTRLEKVEHQIASGAGASAPSSGSGASSGSSNEDAVAVTEYDRLIEEHLQQYVTLSAQIAPEVKEQADLVLQAAHAQRQLIAIAAGSKKPDQAKFTQLFQPTVDIVGKIVALKDANRKSNFFNYLSAVAEGIPALAWVTVEKTPGPYVKEFKGSSEFYSNKILSANKDNAANKSHVDWVKAFNGFLKELSDSYIKAHQTTGLTWNPRGGDASSASPAAAAAPASKPSAAAAPAAASAKPAGGNLFAELSKGENVTSGLKKVTADMKTKNLPADQKSSVVKAIEPKGGREDKDKPKKPAKFSLEGNKWVVENQSGNRDIVISETEPKQTVYIFGCVNSTIQVKGKVNAITVDGCKKTAVVFENAIATFEVVNSSGVEVQITGKVPSVFVDKTDGIQLYFSKEMLNSEIIASKSSAVNVHIPSAKEGDDPIELPVPEQFKTTIVGGKLHTQSVEHKD